jgi:hypothetical protein
MTSDKIQIISDMLTEVAKTLSIIAVAQCFIEAATSEERMFLSQALSNLVGNFQGSRLGRGSQMPFGDQHMY